MIVDMVQQDVPAPSAGAGLNYLQHQVNTVGGTGRKIALAYVGLGAYIVDGAVAVYRGGMRFDFLCRAPRPTDEPRLQAPVR